MNPTINVEFSKKEHDCYSRRKTLEDGTLVIKFICSICGPYIKLKTSPDGQRKMKKLQSSDIPHSGISLPSGPGIMVTNFYSEGLNTLPKIK